MATIVDQYPILLNSDHASQYKNGAYLSDVVFNFQNILDRGPMDISTTVSVLNAQFCCSFYAVDYSVNTLSYQYSAGFYTITIPPGNYNANSLCAALQTQFLTNSHDITVTVNRTTGQLSFAKSGASFQFFATSTCKGVIGLGNANIASVSGVITCPYAMNIIGVTRLRIFSNSLNTKGFDSSGGSSTSSLAIIPVDNSTAAFGFLSYSNICLYAPILLSEHVNSIDIQIFDQNNNLVNFNGTHWQMTLLISVTRLHVEKVASVLAAPQYDLDEEEPEPEPTQEQYTQQEPGPTQTQEQPLEEQYPEPTQTQPEEDLGNLEDFIEEQ